MAQSAESPSEQLALNHFKLYTVKYLGLKNQAWYVSASCSVSNAPETVFLSICAKANLKIDALCFCVYEVSISVFV